MKTGSPDLHVVILAGGQGHRLWPASSAQMPKQFLSLQGAQSLLVNAYARVKRVLPDGSVDIYTAPTYTQLVRNQLPDVPAEQICAFPSQLGNVAAAGLACMKRSRTDLMIVLPADHFIPEAEEPAFGAAIRAAVAAAAQTDKLVLLGTPPDRPETAYGYIGLGAPTAIHPQLYAVQHFVEKPGPQAAEALLAGGKHLWNTGILVCSPLRFLTELHRFLPRLALSLEAGSCAEEMGGEVSISAGILERTEEALCLRAEFAWSDLGTWRTVASLRDRDEQENAVWGQVRAYNSSNLIVRGGSRLITAVGVSDLIVVDTDDALLICHASSEDFIPQVAADVSQPTPPCAT